MGLLARSAFLAQADMAEPAAPQLLGTATGVVNSVSFWAAFVLPWPMGIVMDLIDRPGAPDWRYRADAYRGTFGVVAGALAAALAAAWHLSRRRVTAPTAEPAPGG